MPKLDLRKGICIDCIMAWLLYDDGAECLAGHGRIYWRSDT